uniref:Uncharacterized protein n=1 Tax=Aegilops tauschii subsp. strangulata TaxID=200361 RepID=A0A453HBU1_AEGTS
MPDFILQFWDQPFLGGYISFFTTELNKDTCRRRMFSSVLSTILPQLQKQVCLFTNPIWLVKTRMQLQTPGHTSSYSGFSDALRTIRKEEGWRALYRGIGPGLLLVTHGAIQFTAYEELRKAMISAKSKQTRGDDKGSEDLLNSVDYAALGAGSKLSAILLTYPYQVIRARLQVGFRFKALHLISLEFSSNNNSSCLQLFSNDLVVMVSQSTQIVGM